MHCIGQTITIVKVSAGYCNNTNILFMKMQAYYMYHEYDCNYMVFRSFR